jgi:hypothetical protein
VFVPFKRIASTSKFIASRLNLRRNLSMFKVIASQRKSTQVTAYWCSNETQVQTCVDLNSRLNRALKFNLEMFLFFVHGGHKRPQKRFKNHHYKKFFITLNKLFVSSYIGWIYDWVMEKNKMTFFVMSKWRAHFMIKIICKHRFKTKYELYQFSEK